MTPDDAVSQGKDNENSEATGDSRLDAWRRHVRTLPVAGAGDNQRFGVGEGVAARERNYQLRNWPCDLKCFQSPLDGSFTTRMTGHSARRWLLLSQTAEKHALCSSF